MELQPKGCLQTQHLNVIPTRKIGNSMAQLENLTSQRTQCMGSGWQGQSVIICMFKFRLLLHKKTFWPLPSGNLQTGPISHCRMSPPRTSQLTISHHANTCQRHYALGSAQGLHVYPYGVFIDPVDCSILLPFQTFGCSSYYDSACYA